MSARWTRAAHAAGADLVAAIIQARQARDVRLGLALARAARAGGAAVRHLRDRLRAMLDAQRTRRHLLELDARQLRDIGLTPADIGHAAAELRPLAVLFGNPGARRIHQSGGASW